MPISIVASPTYGYTGVKNVRVYSIVCPGFHALVGVGGSWSSVYISISSWSAKCTIT